MNSLEYDLNFSSILQPNVTCEDKKSYKTMFDLFPHKSKITKRVEAYQGLYLS
jgi:hypothetical protein